MSIEIEIPRYTLIRELGSGGMAVVYLATQEGLDRPVAVKVLRKSLSAAGEEFRQRFEHEGRMLAQLEHENIVKIYDIGSTDDSVYMVMEYLRGGTLSQKMQQGDLVVGDVIKICAQVGLALHAAHRKNIIHRDLKPSNIMFRDSVSPVLTDFGIARKIDQDMTLTATGMMIGTPQYMSPEQIQGKAVDARSDIYSLGLMFYRLLTGELPFKATDPIAMAMQQIQEPPPALPEEFAELQPVIDLMLAKAVEDRYQSMLDFCNHLSSISLTGDHYATELSTATRIFSTARLLEPASMSGTGTARPDTQVSGASRAFSSISTAVSTVLKRKKPRYILLGSILAVIVAVFAASQFFSHGLSDAEIRKVERELRRFNAYMDLEQITEPAGENATVSIQRLREMAPEYGAVEEAAEMLANEYERLAYDDYDADRIDEAKTWVDQALAFSPDHDGLNELRESLDLRISERDRLIRIDNLLATGNQALADNNLLPPAPGNAFDAFSEVRSLDLQNEVAEAGLSDIQKRIADQASGAWRSGERDRAQALLSQGLNVFSDSTLLLNVESTIQRELNAEREQRELERLLALAEQQFASGNLVDPPGYNALESYRQARDLRPNDLVVAQGLQNIADHFRQLAQARFDEGEFQASLEAVASGLKAMPDDPALLDAQASATSRLDETERQIQTLLQQAERLVSTGQLIPGQPGMAEGADNATDAFNRLLEIDPGNVRATAGLSRIPAGLDDAASQLQREGRLADARAMLVAAQAFYQDQARYQTRIAILDQRLADLEFQQRMDARLAELDELFEVRPFTPELMDRIAAELRSISGEFPNEIKVSDRLSRFITLISDQADGLSETGDDTGALALIDSGLLLYPTNARLTRTRSGVEGRQAERAAEERRRIAAMSGVLAVDASPWGRVLEIRNAGQELQTLPGSGDTPLSITLLEGDYTVVLAGPDGSSRFELPVSVNRQTVQLVRPDQSLMNSGDYFEKSGW
jgi:serine/threonine protein kinase